MTGLLSATATRRWALLHVALGLRLLLHKLKLLVAVPLLQQVSLQSIRLCKWVSEASMRWSTNAARTSDVTSMSTHLEAEPCTALASSQSGRRQQATAQPL